MSQQQSQGEAPFIRLSGITKRFGDFTAVNNLSLDIRRGELFCLLGGSGSGKSTLLRMLAGFETPDEGVIEIDGQPMIGVGPADRPVNMMFQSYALFPHMSVERNVGYGLRQEGVAKAEIADRVSKMLDMVRLKPFASRKPHQLSGGQRQRVALARALVKQPKVLLLDEPLSALDAKLREDTQYELMQIQDRLKTTFIVVTHDQEEAMVLAERIGVMDQGVLVQVDTPRHIYEFPKNRFIADFVGSVNMLEAGVLGPGGAPGLLRVDCPGLGGVVEAACEAAPAAGAKAWLAVRPEKITLSRDLTATTLLGQVEELAYRGDMTQYRIRMPSGVRLKVARTNRAREGEAPIDWDDQVSVSFSPQGALVLTD
ncbi:ABC transporter ATP-binding protein [Oceanicella sp. SM1341]|uniref:ABC transporter ATP-binding protein n=1 Tax=Oceanicella sp. SM1341 TaxID=1548889 RepID=UPI000E4E26D9|nr:ABC transporter ATP-binding protein [Oceanicella sp. SM1341]